MKAPKKKKKYIFQHTNTLSPYLCVKIFLDFIFCFKQKKKKKNYNNNNKKCFQKQNNFFFLYFPFCI